MTPKQEKFAQLVASGQSLSDAYRAAYCVGENTAPDVVNVKASQVMSDGKVTVRVDVLRAQYMTNIAQEVSYEYEDAMSELDEAIQFAKQNGASAAYVAALNLKQKISGLHVEDRKNDRNPVAGMGPDRVKAALAALAVMRKAKVAAHS